ncbi:hypothetical protein ABS71_21370 [bacterium SCN 62-11]|nr:MAG: hypothetical protein ABS71_21370 [bacterium SCN 62-11]
MESAIGWKCRLLAFLLAGAVSAEKASGWHFYATDRSAYSARIDRQIAHSGGSSAHLRSNPAAVNQSFGLYWQKIDAARFRGQRVRLSAYLRTSGVRGWAGMWMRIDPKDGPSLEFENMQRRPLVGSNDWKAYQIELDVAEEAEEIHFGCLLVGQGEVWFDDINLQAAGPFQAGERQVRRARHLPISPVDPSFEGEFERE